MLNVLYKIFTNKKTSVIFAAFIALGIAWRMLLPDWSFLSSALRVWAPKIAWLFLIYILIFGFLKTKRTGLKILITLLAIPCIYLPLVILFLFGNKPIDTYTEPKDVIVLKTFDKHKKIVVREFENTAGDKDYDTAIVEDYFIFRKELSATKPHIEILGL